MSIKTYSLYDIAYMFVCKFKKERTFTKKEKLKIVTDIYNLLHRGFTDTEMFIYFKKFGSNGYFDIENAFKNIQPNTKNLLKPNRIYFHSQLILTSGKPDIDFDYNSGQMKVCLTNYYFENVASYTFNNVVDYYKSKAIYSTEYVSDQRINGTFKWLIDKYDIEVLLFMIDIYDEWVECNIIDNSYNPIELSNAYKNAIISYKNKTNESAVMGVNKIVPKQRLQIS